MRREVTPHNASHTRVFVREFFKLVKLVLNPQQLSANPDVS